MKQISKEWCLYGCGHKDVGKVVDEGPKSATILHSESQYYAPSLWDSAYVERFETLEEAFEIYKAKHRPHHMTLEELENNLRYRYPSYFKKKRKNK